jgi:transcriptional regulator GlxA family with amidase domain
MSDLPRVEVVMKIGIYIYEQAEVLDFSGPFEVFATAMRLQSEEKITQVFLIAESTAPVVARAGYSVNPHFSIHQHPKIDVLIVVGGVHTAEVQKPQVIQWIKNTAAKSTYVASVCTGAFLLAQAGVLKNLSVTTHWQDIDDLREAYPDLHVVEQQRWVEQGRVITSAGISAGIDMSLHLLATLSGQALAIKTAKQMDYAWQLN